jgi:hypothetical protein
MVSSRTSFRIYYHLGRVWGQDVLYFMRFKVQGSRFKVQGLETGDRKPETRLRRRLKGDYDSVDSSTGPLNPEIMNGSLNRDPLSAHSYLGPCYQAVRSFRYAEPERAVIAAVCLSLFLPARRLLAINCDKRVFHSHPLVCGLSGYLCHRTRGWPAGAQACKEGNAQQEKEKAKFHGSKRYNENPVEVKIINKE